MNKLVDSIDELKFFTKIGTVEGANTWSETSVTTTHHAGHTSPSGHTRPGYSSYSTSTKEKNRFFLKQESGKETEVELVGNNFSVRNGHEVGLFYVGLQKEEFGWPVLYHNYNTEKTWVREANLQAARGKAFAGGCGAMAAWAVVVVGLGLGLLGSADFLIFGLIALPIAIIVSRKARVEKAKAAELDAKILEVGNRRLGQRIVQVEHVPLSSG